MKLNSQPESQPDSGTPNDLFAHSESGSHPRLRLHHGFHSSFLPDHRDVIVYLPPGYEQHAERRYPVLYLQDGQNLFDGQTSFVPGRTWQLREHADAAIEAGEVDPLIIVGVYNTGERRMAEYTPDRDPQRGGGEASAYGRLLTEELMPWIASQYRVRPDRASTGIGGSSLGGLVSLYLGLRYPTRFGKIAVLSPSVWWNQRSVLDFVTAQEQQASDPARIWLDAGDAEGKSTQRDAELLARRLRARGWTDGRTLHFEVVPHGTHDETSWSRRVRPMLRFLFPHRLP